jgi:tetratricopeptide (TPR) repeat protein
MRKSLVTIVLAVAVSAGICTAQQQPAAGQAAPQQKKEIKDPAEYNAYLNALNTADPNQKAVLLEGFLQQYPNSVMKMDALELLMASYQQAGNMQKVVDTANRLLQADPNNLRALALLTYINRTQAQAGGANAQQSLAAAQQYGQRGLQALQTAQKPADVSEADFEKLKKETSIIFNGSVGIAALQNKDYAAAQRDLLEAVKANPNNLNDIYPLALAYLQAPAPSPQGTQTASTSGTAAEPQANPNQVNGLWFIARAVNLAAQNAAAQQQISRFGKAAYVKYHGGDDGWDQLVQQTAQTPMPPANFTIAPAPTLAEQAAKLVQTKAVSDMSFDEFQMIFTSGNQQAADQVWSQIKGKPIAFAAQTVSVSPTKLTLSATANDIEKKTPDVEVTMVAPIPANLRPKVGAMTQVQATPESYTAQPFMINMDQGTLVNTGTRRR